MVGRKPSAMDLTYEYSHLGDDVQAIPSISSILGGGRAMLIVGQDPLFSHVDAIQTWSSLAQLITSQRKKFFTDDGWNGFNVLPRTASFTGALKIGYKPSGLLSSPQTKISLAYLLNVDDAQTLSSIPKDTFVIYQGHHGDAGAARADLILPGAAYTEKDAMYINMEGRAQMTRRAVPPPGESREDWQIVRALSEFTANSSLSKGLGAPLPYDSARAIRAEITDELQIRLDQVAIHSHSSRRDPASQWDDLAKQLASRIIGKGTSGKRGRATTIPYGPMGKEDYYLTDCISRNSPTMAKCSLAFTYGTWDGDKDGQNGLNDRTDSSNSGDEYNL
jgi:NADH dehydrogenase (ubiquinone) Fe-S protein 1